MRITRTFALALILVGALALAGCLGNSDPLAEQEPESATGPGSALLSWYPPTERTDGTPLSGLSGYRVYYGKSLSSPSRIIEVTNPGQTSQFIENLSVGTWYFSITAYDNQGFESSKSPPASKTIG